MSLPEDINLVQQLDQLIRLKATGSPDKLAQKIGKSRRQVYRIINGMKHLGFPISYCRNRKTFYYEKKVSFIFEVCVIGEKESKTTIGGGNFPTFWDFFPSVPDFGTRGEYVCRNNVVEG